MLLSSSNSTQVLHSLFDVVYLNDMNKFAVFFYWFTKPQLAVCSVRLQDK